MREHLMTITKRQATYVDTYNPTLRHVRVSIVAVEKHYMF